MCASVLARAGLELLARKNSFRPNWEVIKPIALKISIVALTILALGVATYFSGGLALVPFLMGAVTWQTSLGFVGAVGLGVGTLLSPFFAYEFNMHRCTAHNGRDIFKFLRASLGVTLISSGALLFRYFQVISH